MDNYSAPFTRTEADLRQYLHRLTDKPAHLFKTVNKEHRDKFALALLSESRSERRSTLASTDLQGRDTNTKQDRNSRSRFTSS